MKKFLVVLLSLGLLVAFSAPASALDVSFGGTYQIVGAYEDNAMQTDGGSFSRTAIWQRFRLQPVFKVAEGLTMTVRMDALEKQWGNTAWRGGPAGGSADDLSNSRRMPGTSTTNREKIQENFEFERSYVTFKTMIGQFDIGYQAIDQWGTAFNDAQNSRPKALFTTMFGPVVLLAAYEKVYENDMLGISSGTYGGLTKTTDEDYDTYALAGIYKGKGLEGGLLYKYYAVNYSRMSPTDPSKGKISQLSPYVKATFGPVYVEAELVYFFGKYAEYEGPSKKTDVDMQAWGGYVKGQLNLGPAYFGAQGGYSSGDDFSDAGKKKNQVMAKDWNTTLLMLSDSYMCDVLPGGNAYDAGNYSSVKNAPAGFLIGNVFGGFNVTPKLNLEVNLTYAQFDKNPRVGNTAAGAEYTSNKIGTELDIQATYKIYDNLAYMVGAGYMWSGDSFKGASTAAVGNDYVLLNRLALSF
jgi:hypothetical protein